MGVVSLSLPADGSTGTVSQYNTPLTTLQTEFNGNIDNNNIKAGAGIDGSKLADGTVTGAKITNYKVSRDNAGSTVTEATAKIQTGWKAAQPGVSTGAAMVITFPVAFTNVPIVTASYGGDTAAVTNTLGSGGGNVKQCIAEVLAVTTTGFTLQILTRDGTNYAANNTVYGHWTAIGI